MKTYITALEALNAFVAQRSGIDCRDYSNRAAYMGDYRPMLQNGTDYRKMARFVALSSISNYDLVKGCGLVFSGRLVIDGNLQDGYNIDYTTGQYFPTEYRRAACCVIAQVITTYWKDCGYDKHELLNKAKKEFGRAIAMRHFN